MTTIEVIKYITGFATTFLAIYALMHDFKKEVKDEKGELIKKKLTKSGKINIAILILLALITTSISITENKKNRLNQEKITELEEERYLKTQQSIEKNLEQVKGILETVSDIKENDSISSAKNIEKQKEIAVRLQRSNDNLKSIEKITNELNTDFQNKMNHLQENIALADEGIQKFHESYLNSKDVFDKLSLVAHFKLMHTEPGLASFLMVRIINPNHRFSAEGMKYFSQYFSLSSNRYYSGLSEDNILNLPSDSINIKEAIKQISYWTNDNGLSPVSLNEIHYEINKLIRSNDVDDRFTGYYLKALTNFVTKTLNDDDNWLIIVDYNNEKFDIINNVASTVQLKQYSDFFITDNFSSFGYQDFSEGLRITNLNFVNDGIEFDISFDLSQRSFDESVFRLSEMNELGLHFKSDFISYGDKVAGYVELNNSLRTKMSFSGTYSVLTQ